MSTMNIFATVKVYAGKWAEKSNRGFSEEELAMFSRATIVPSKYGMSVEFTMITGGKSYIPVEPDADVTVGEVLIIPNCRIVELSRPGEEDITRIRVIK